MGFPSGSAVKNLPAMQETGVWSLGKEDPLEEEMATHSSILAWEIPWTEEPSGLYSPWGRKESAASEQLTCPHHTNIYIRVYQSSLICVFQIISNVGHTQLPTWLTLTKHLLCARWFHIHYFRDSTSDSRPRLNTMMMREVVLMKTHGHARSSTCFMSYSGYWVMSSLPVVLWPLPLDFDSVITWDPGKNHS